MACDNLEAAKKLVETYRAVTLEELVKKFEEYYDRDGDSVMYSLTGFGSYSRCSLCNAIFPKKCEGCIHYSEVSCGYPCTRHETYKNISCAEDAEELLCAVKARADYIELLIETIENDN